MNFLHLIELLYSIGFLVFLIATRFTLKSKRMFDKKIIELTGLTNDLRAARLADPAAGDECKARRKTEDYKARGGGI